MANTIGTIFGFVLPAIFYDDNNKDTQVFKDSTATYLLVNAIITSALSIPLIIFMKEKPEIPPSNSQYNKIELSFKDSVKFLLKNKNFRSLLLCTTGIVGYFNVYGTVINEVFDSYGITPSQTSILGAVANISGIIGSIIVSIIVDKIRAYKKIFLIINGMSVIFHFALTLFVELYQDSAFNTLLILWTLITMCIIPIFSISMDFVCELTYPVGNL